MWWVWAVALAADIATPAGADATKIGTGAPNLAEYNRLTQELEDLAAKNAWAGVERTFEELVATGVRPSVPDYLRGAEAARSLGDIGDVYARLLSAREIEPFNQTVVDWLYDIDQHFAQVELICDPNSLLQLECAEMPFDPEAVRVIRYAQQQIRDRCAFSGRLPTGKYRFYVYDVQVTPRAQAIHLDLRGVVFSKPVKKELKERWDAETASTAPAPQ